MEERHIFGLQPVREALAAHGERVVRIFVVAKERPDIDGSGAAGTSLRTDGSGTTEHDESKTIAGVVRLAEHHGVPVTRVSALELDRRTKQGRHQGVLAVVPPLAVQSLAALETELAPGARCVIMALDEIEDPQNFGAIVRTSVALGAFAILWPEHHSAPLSPAMVRASAGAVEHARLVRVPQLPEALRTLHDQHAFEIVGLDANGDAELDARVYPERVVLVVGAEGKGLRKGVKRACDALVRLPMAGPIASLNASVAAALALHGVLRTAARS